MTACLRKLLILALAAAGSSAAHAGGLVSGVKVIKVGVEGNVVFVKTDAANVPGTPACSINGYWHFAYPAVNQAMTAVLLSGRMAGTAALLAGNGTCTSYGSIEELVSVQM